MAGVAETAIVYKLDHFLKCDVFNWRGMYGENISATWLWTFVNPIPTIVLFRGRSAKQNSDFNIRRDHKKITLVSRL